VAVDVGGQTRQADRQADSAGKTYLAQLQLLEGILVAEDVLAHAVAQEAQRVHGRDAGRDGPDPLVHARRPVRRDDLLDAVQDASVRRRLARLDNHGLDLDLDGVQRVACSSERNELSAMCV
jgi:hypothetical protein